jgi:hypothetical protein
VVHRHAALQQRQQPLHLRQLAVVLAQEVDRAMEDVAHHGALLGRVELERAHLPRQRLAALLAKGEDDQRRVGAFHDHLHLVCSGMQWRL